MNKTNLKIISWIIISIAVVIMLLIRQDLTGEVKHDILKVIILFLTSIGMSILGVSFLRKADKESAFQGIAIGLLLGTLLYVLWKPIRSPILDNSMLSSIPIGKVGHTEPPVISLGEEIQLTILDSIRNDKDNESLLGMWFIDKVNITETPLKINNSALITWKLINVHSISDSAIWDMTKNYFTGPGVPHTFRSKNKPFVPWIAFTLPQNNLLYGQNINFRVTTKIFYPFYHGSYSYSNYYFAFDSQFTLKIASYSEAEAYKRWTEAYKKRTYIDNVRYFFMIILIILNGIWGIFLLIALAAKLKILK